MNRPLAIPPITAEDRIPHEKAVWREYDVSPARQWLPPIQTGLLPVSIEYRNGQIISALAHQADWFGAKRWRFGWPPA